MTYSESAQGKMITYERAIRELKRHGLQTHTGSRDRTLFDRECWEPNVVVAAIPWESTIDAKYVMNWLGY
jgi:hypothetical protein